MENPGEPKKWDCLEEVPETDSQLKVLKNNIEKINDSSSSKNNHSILEGPKIKDTGLINYTMKQNSNLIEMDERIHQSQPFKTWSYGTINIRSGKEKEEGAKIYAIAKEVSRAGLKFCCLQEVRYRNIGNKLIRLNTGEEFEFHWCGQKKRRDAGVGILIQVHDAIEISNPDINNPRIMAINMKIHGFNLRVVNGYSPTESDGSDHQKQVFYRELKEACMKTENTRS